MGVLSTAPIASPTSRRRAPPPALECPGECSPTAQIVQSHTAREIKKHFLGLWFFSQPGDLCSQICNKNTGGSEFAGVPPPTSMAQRDLNRLASGLRIQVGIVHINLSFRASTSQRTSNQVPSTNRVGKSVGPAIWVLKALKMDVRTRLGKSRPAPAWWSIQTNPRHLLFPGRNSPRHQGGSWH